MNKILFSSIVAITLVAQLYGQKTVNHHAEFNSGVNNMWGPSFSPVNLDKTITLFNAPWNVSTNTGNSGIVSVGGLNFGGAFSGAFSGSIGSSIEIKGFTSGNVEVDYPVDIELIMNEDEEYDPGDVVTIATDYEVESGWELATTYPTTGEFFWDLNFQFAASASATLCLFGCVTLPIIPSFNTGLQSINLVTISGNGASTPPDPNGDPTTGIWYLGPSNFLAGDLTPSVDGGIWPFAKPPATSAQLTAGPPAYIPWQVFVPCCTAELPSAFGLSGEITIPNVVTDDTLNLADNSLSACGESPYLNLNLEIFKLLGAVLRNVPEPITQAIGVSLGYLSGEEEIGGLATVSWTFFSASFDLNITNNQCFEFNPTIFGRFDFPIPVSYQVTHNGVTSPFTTGSIINFEVGDIISYRFPCYFDSLSITPTYSIDGQFRNHTYDSVSFDFLMSAVAFGIEVPEVTVIPGFTIPEICVNLPYPCPTWSNPFRICWANLCTPEIVVPPIGFPGFQLELGPLFEESEPLGGFTYDWYDRTWALEGFQDTTFLPFFMKPYKMGISHIPSDVSCSGGNDGQIDVIVDQYSDAFPFNLEWTNGITSTVSSSTFSHTNLSGGSHVLSLVDNNGCQLITGATLQEPLPLSVSYTSTDKNCFGPVNDGSISLTVTGGIAPYTYAWSNLATTSSISGLAAGTYSVTVTDANLCTIIDSITISEPLLLDQIATTTDVLCNGDTTGTIELITFGGSLPYSFSWSTGDTTENIGNLGAGSYSLVITDANGCQSAGLYNIVEPALPLATALTATEVSCFGADDGVISSSVTGGTAPYSYQWMSDQTILPFTGPSIANLVSGTYTMTVIDANDCVISQSIVINQPAAPIEQDPILVDVLCYGDATGSITTNIIGGTPAYSYVWNTGATSSDITGVLAGNYSVQITDQNGCSETYSYVINQPAAPLTVSLTFEDVKCFGEITGSINAIVEGGVASYAYLWSNGDTTNSIDGLPAGLYSVDITDANGCATNASVMITQPANPIALSTITTDVDCFGNASGSVDLTVAGGTSPYTYQWTNLYSFILTDTTQDISNQIAGEYSALVTDENGCQETILTTINEPVAPLTASGIVTNIDCFGISEGQVDLTPSGGSGGYTFLWSDGSANEDLSNVVAGSYSVTVNDVNGCQYITGFTITQPTSPVSVVLAPQDAKCFGELSGSVQSFASGGTTPYTYVWSNGAATNGITNVAANTYTLTVTDALGCTAFSGATVNEPAEIIITPTVTDASCYGYEDGEIVVTIQGGIQPYNFIWGNLSGIVLNNPSETLTGLGASDYLVRLIDANNCAAEITVTLGEPPVYEANLTVIDVSCFAGTDGEIAMDLIGGTQPYSTIWSNGASTEDISNLTAGVYSFITTDSQGCELRGQGQVSQPDEIKITYQIIDVTCIDQSDASIDVSAYGGTPPYNYTWTNGEQGSSIQELAPGIYELTITDFNNCENMFEFSINEEFSECLIIPNTFTPNSDNYNDTWVLGNLDLYEQSTVKIFNKWGNEVYSNGDAPYSPWDGTNNGRALPSGVYYYIIILNNEQNNQYTGTVTIVR